MHPAGRFNRPVTIEAPVNSVDAAGQPIAGWAAITGGAVMADVAYERGLRALESLAAGRDVSVIRCSVRVHYRADLTTAMRVRDRVDGTIYRVIGINPDKQRRAYVDMVCEVVNG